MRDGQVSHNLQHFAT